MHGNRKAIGTTRTLRKSILIHYTTKRPSITLGLFVVVYIFSIQWILAEESMKKATYLEKRVLDNVVIGVMNAMH